MAHRTLMLAAMLLTACGSNTPVHETTGSGGAATSSGAGPGSSGTGGAAGTGGAGSSSASTGGASSSSASSTSSAATSSSSSSGTTGPCAGKIGTYCGSTLGLDPGTLYGCNDDMPMVDKQCTKGCVTHGNGMDACACPYGDGTYCGQTIGQGSSTLYQCTGGVYTVKSQCIGTCQVMPPMVPDTCGSCGSGGNGLYCGSAIGQDGTTLYNCQNGAITVAQKCQGPCTVNPPGTNDTCGNGMCPQGNGAYCGGPIGKDPNTLYDCNNGTYTVTQSCPNGCNVSPPGTPDYCKGNGQLSCANLQWWNSALTYGPYQLNNGGQTWWDTDLAVGNNTPVQLRHDSKLVQAPVEPWGWQPRFVDMTTGKTFQFLHLHPQAQYTTAVGTVYPAGTIVGLSGGGTTDTGYGTYSTGPHLCVETLDTWLNTFPKGNDPCH